MNQILLVRFHDIQTKRNWRTGSTIDEIKPMLTSAVGFELTGGQDGYIYLSALMTDEGDCAELTIIPCGCIVDIKPLGNS